MMMTRTLLLTVNLGLITTLASAQQDSSRRYGYAPLSLFCEPLSLAPTADGGSLRLGIEAPLNKRIGIAVTGINFGGKQYGFKAGLKYYRHRFAAHVVNDKGRIRKARENSWFGIEFAYKDHCYAVKDSLRLDMRPIIYDVSKFAATYCVQYGYTYTYPFGLYYDAYAAAGVRIKTVQNTLNDDQIKQLYHWHEGDVGRIADLNCDHITVPYLAFCLRIGYRHR